MRKNLEKLKDNNMATVKNRIKVKMKATFMSGQLILIPAFKLLS